MNAVTLFLSILFSLFVMLAMGSAIRAGNRKP